MDAHASPTFAPASILCNMHVTAYVVGTWLTEIRDWVNKYSSYNGQIVAFSVKCSVLDVSQVRWGEVQWYAVLVSKCICQR